MIAQGAENTLQTLIQACLYDFLSACNWKSCSTRRGKSKVFPWFSREQKADERTKDRYSIIASISFLGVIFPQEAVQDLISALKVEAGAVIPAILSLKPEAQGLVTEWLLQHGRAALTKLMATRDLPGGETLEELLTVAKALTKICKAAQNHIFYTDVLMANGESCRSAQLVWPGEWAVKG